MSMLSDEVDRYAPGPMNRGMEITADVADSKRSVIVETGGQLSAFSGGFVLIARGLFPAQPAVDEIVEGTDVSPL